RLEKIRVVCPDGILTRKLDLVVDDVQDRGLLVAFGPGLREGGVEVRPYRRRRAGGRERVTTSARGLEDLAAVRLVRGRADHRTARTTCRHHQDDSHPPDGC